MPTIKRIINNSENLQKAFPAIYRDFFSKCQVVTSASGSFFFTGDHLSLYGGVAIKQKLPLNVYVGLKNIAGGKFEIASFKYLDPSQKKWKELNDKSAFEKVVCLVIKELEKIGSNNGYSCSVLSEVPPNCGLKASGAFAAALAGAIYLDNRIVNHDDIIGFKELKSQELIKNHKFNLIFYFAWRIDAAFGTEVCSGNGPFSALISSNFPIVYFTEKRTGNVNSHNTRIPLFIGENYELLDQIKYWGFRLSDLLGVKDELNYPVDFGLIYSGNIKSTELGIKVSQAVQNLIQRSTNFAKHLLKNCLPTDKNNIFFYTTLTDKNGGYWKNFLETMNELSLECWMSLSLLLTKRCDDETFRDFFRSINRYHNMLQFLRVSTSAINRIRSYINHQTNLIGENIGGAAKLTGAGKGGDVLFVAPHGYLRDSMNGIIEFLRKDLNRDIWLDYASWIDGAHTKGLEICQDLQKQIYSSFICRGAVVLEVFQKNKHFGEVLCPGEFEKERNKFDILLDPINDDIYVGQKQIRSKEIHSAKTTIKVLERLLKDIERDFSNLEFGHSSYTADRNEFQSKIISPLKKALKKYRQKDLDLKINGGITNFLVKLDIDDLTIAIVKNIT